MKRKNLLFNIKSQEEIKEQNINRKSKPKLSNGSKKWRECSKPWPLKLNWSRDGKRKTWPPDNESNEDRRTKPDK